MPVIKIEMGKIDSDVKKKLIENLSTAASDITNIPLKNFTVLIREYNTDNIGIGAKTLTEIMASH